MAEVQSRDDDNVVDGPVLLESSWSVWYGAHPASPPAAATQPPHAAATQPSWDSALLKLATFGTATGFWATWRLLPPPSELAPGCGLHLFREGTRPVWEESPRGGKWALSLPPSAAAWGSRCGFDTLWDRTALALIGEQLGSGAVGCVATLRRCPQRQRLQLWVREAGNAAEVLAVGRAWRTAMELPRVLSIEFFPHYTRIAASSQAVSSSVPRATYTL